MVIARKPGPTNLKTQVGICLLAGISSIALAGVVVTLSTPAVQADVKLSRPAATMPPAAPILSETPALLAPPIARKSKLDKGADLLHGIASWYGSVLNGHRTASGERFDMYAMTACHPTLPFGSVVRVVNQSNHRSVVVRINDRGDLVVEGRIIDLSYGAAEKLAMIKPGIARVDLEVLSRGESHPKNHER